MVEYVYASPAVDRLYYGVISDTAWDSDGYWHELTGAHGKIWAPRNELFRVKTCPAQSHAEERGLGWAGASR